jgi:hypothetical protein
VTAPLPLGSSGQSVDMTTPDNTYGISRFGQSNVTNLALPMVALSDEELAFVSRLTSRVLSKRYQLELRDAYYRGTVRIQDLGISIPPQMRNVHTVVGWPRVACDALDQRLNVDGFRYPDSNDVDTELQEIWLGNDLDAEHSLGNLDSLVFGCGYVGVGSPETGPNTVDTPPLITVESPRDVAVEWDARTRTIVAALRLYGFEGSRQATLYLPDQTISVVQTGGGWTVIDRDVHRLGQAMIVRLPNRARSYDRDGSSEITTEIMSLTDAASRTLLGLAVAGEFYSAPQRYILGADESAFQDGAGNAKTGWETYLGRVLALERDPEGNTPTVGQFTAYDPSVYTKVIDSYAQRMSALTGLPPHALGFATANPTSADAIRSAEMELTRRADHKTVSLGKGWRDVMKLALLVRDGSLPPKANQITAVWSSTATPTIAATTDAVFKQVTMGYLPATSDVVGEVLGYSAVQRERIEVDRLNDQGTSFLNELAHSIGAKTARVDKGLSLDIAPNKATATAPGAAPTPSPTATPPPDVVPGK